MKDKNKNNEVKEVAIESGSGLAAAGTGMVIGGSIGGPLGLVIGGLAAPILQPIIKDVLQRQLSKREKDRIEQVAEYALRRIQEQTKSGAKASSKNQQKLGELFEGTLLAARDAYEEKKIPILGNIVAKAPFTNTPIENMNQTLLLAEQLSYRQICIVAAVGANNWGTLPFKLNDKSLKEEPNKNHDEAVMGVYHDIQYLINNEVIVQVTAEGNSREALLIPYDIVPSRLVLDYPGRLLFNGGELSLTVPKEDLANLKPIFITN